MKRRLAVALPQNNMKNINDNVGKCGHARCAGGNGILCYQKGAPMRTYEEIKREYAKVNCTNCHWQGNKAELILKNYFDHCPHCSRPDCLMDIDPS